MSDTHSLTPHLTTPVPEGDVFVHAGDFTKCGRPEEVDMFNSWLGKCQHPLYVYVYMYHAYVTYVCGMATMF